MTYKTCVTIAEKTPKKLSQIVKKAAKKSNYVEIRFDFLSPRQVPESLELVKKYLKRSVCTLRPKSEGGKFSGNENERLSILKLIAEYNPFLLDVEYNTLRKNKQFTSYIKKTRTDLLVSWHDFKKTPNDSALSKILNQMTKFSKNIKIVTTAKSTNDSSRVLSLYNNSQKLNLIAFSMGEYGKMSRILCLFLGSPYTYVSLGKAIALGQFSLDEIKSIIKI
ncbi:MAG: type I 3-dehydroquinate dehydratase [Thaumarchaeota archaeon]|nr:type I 3-dehydroquinate dehydratase [Nitrososphaerota archaeon]